MRAGLTSYERPRKVAPARLAGFRRFGVTGAPYPAIVAAGPDDSVEGVLSFVRTAAEVELLDVFETSMYRRETVETTVAESWGMRTVEADVFVWNKDPALLDGKPWDFDNFLAHRMAEWMQVETGSGGQPLVATADGVVASEAS
nr:hypothetical protein HK105_004394 [Polyrhizophydium stewartii]